MVVLLSDGKSQMFLTPLSTVLSGVFCVATTFCNLQYWGGKGAERTDASPVTELNTE